ncbi:glycosyltransferase [Nocardioides massiliensis]|uniref:Glycosyltransferase involved in cell wall biosynthesis n=1 Tax=Nocardioides massiliensis TaxID=1325935 RepID=A0ABT9NM95_9ACTN|nr:glycosyltransferase [Nocardioides massiliensis]MDP9821542.1 glycosyltransferase involved in cell wall biosynthesis [Nocardioides massiliensis]
MSGARTRARIVTVIPVMGVGGAEAVAADLVLEARRRGHDVLLASAGGFRADDVAAQGVAHLAVPMDGRSARDLARAVRTLRTSFTASPPDLVHAHNVKAALVARLAAGRRCPVLVTLHGVPAGELRLAARILRRCADHVVAVSPYVATQLADHGYPADRVTVVANAVTPLALPERQQARAELDLDEAAPVALCLARFADQKRHDLLLDAWTETPDDALLLLAGDGPTLPRVRAQVERLGLTDRVRLLGPRTDVPRLLAATDLVVLPTDWEGLPISLLEAMSSGVPVVASAVGGVRDTLGPALRLVPPGTAAALARALTDLLADRDERARLAHRGRRLVHDEFGPDRMHDGYAATYARLVPPSLHEVTS